LIQKEIRENAGRFFGPGSSDVGIETFSPDNSKADDIFSSLCTSSLFSSKRFVVLSGFEEDDYEKILSNADNIPDSTMLVISEDKIDKRTSFFKAMQKAGEVKEFKPLTEWETESWISRMFESRGKSIDRKDVELLVQVSGTLLRKLDTEIEKICVYAFERDRITGLDIMEMASQGELSSYAVENALASKDARAMLSAITLSLKSKEYPEYLISKLAGKVRTYLEIKLLQGKKMQKQSIISGMRLNPGYYEHLAVAAQKYTVRELIAGIKALHAADIALKTTGQSPDVIMELLSLALTSGSKD
jgi:DNA polymerase-3 subunit delta